MNGNEYGYVRVSSTEQNEDRQLIALKKAGIDDKNIYIFYLKYPQICSTVSNKLKGIPQLQENLMISIDDLEKCSTVSSKFVTPPELLINKLSFSHIREIMVLDDPVERCFYEIECIKGTWSVRELRRQISTNLFVRAGISKHPEILLKQIEKEDMA